jgi:hypothetical protein
MGSVNIAMPSAGSALATWKEESMASDAPPVARCVVTALPVSRRGERQLSKFRFGKSECLGDLFIYANHLHENCHLWNFSFPLC